MPLWYGARNDVLPSRIGSPLLSVTQNWKCTEIWRGDKYFECWSYHVGRWVVGEATWKTVPKPLKSFLQKWTAETIEFSGFWILRSVQFRHFYHIFIGFRTPLTSVQRILARGVWPPKVSDENSPNFYSHSPFPFPSLSFPSPFVPFSSLALSILSSLVPTPKSS